MGSSTSVSEREGTFAAIDDLRTQQEWQADEDGRKVLTALVGIFGIAFCVIFEFSNGLWVELGLSAGALALFVCSLFWIARNSPLPDHAESIRDLEQSIGVSTPQE